MTEYLKRLKEKDMGHICPKKPDFKWNRTATFDDEEENDLFQKEILKYAHDNIAMVTIFIREPFAEEILIQEQKNGMDFISEIGGLLGLMMGCSLVTFVEIIYHILRVNFKDIY